MNELWSIVLLTLIGILGFFIAKRSRAPVPLILILTGIALSWSPLEIKIPEMVISIIIFVAVALVSFDVFARLDIHNFDSISHEALTISVYYGTFTIAVMTISSYLILSNYSIASSVMFAALLIGTASINEVKIRKRAYFVLDEESSINRGICLMIVFAIASFYVMVSQGLITLSTWHNVGAAGMKTLLSIGSGIVMGIIIFKVVKENFFIRHRHLILLLGVIAAYSFTALLGGEPVFAMATLGLMFGALSLERKHELYEFSGFVAEGIEIWVFLLAGLIISFNFYSTDFIIHSVMLFLIFKLSRFVSITAAMHHHKYSFKEKLFLTLNSSKGITVITAVLAMLAYNIPNISIVAEYVLAISLYSLVVSALSDAFSKHFIGDKD